MEFLSKEIILGLTVQEFLLHLLNFIILVVVLRLLLYKPVKKFMEKRDKEYKDADSKYRESVKAIEENQAKEEKILDEARDEAVHIAEEAHALAMIQNDEIINSAREEAKKIIAKATSDSAKAVAKDKEEMLHSINNLAVDISKKILDRELTNDDNDKFIDNLINNLDDKNA